MEVGTKYNLVEGKMGCYTKGIGCDCGVDMKKNKEYKQWLIDLKNRIRQSQIKAAVNEIRQQVADELENHPIFQIPWFHHVQIITKCKTVKEALFYHLELRCFVVIELKAGKFEAEHTGKLGLYVSAINHQRKKEIDNPTIGLIICKTKDEVMAQYSLESSSQPIGISEYDLSNMLPENYKSALPSIEELEEELRKMDV